MNEQLKKSSVDEQLMNDFFEESKKAGQKSYSVNVNFFGIDEGKNW